LLWGASTWVDLDRIARLYGKIAPCLPLPPLERVEVAPMALLR
jgi:hypothetical protein